MLKKAPSRYYITDGRYQSFQRLYLNKINEKYGFLIKGLKEVPKYKRMMKFVLFTVFYHLMSLNFQWFCSMSLLPLQIKVCFIFYPP